MSQKYQKLKTLLMELFQLDQPDLDFGLYRVMHAKRAEISQFLDNDLLPQVHDAFSHYSMADRTGIERELSRLIAAVESAGMNPDDSPKVKELQDKLETMAVDVGALESEVYEHLYNFFRRYYSDGDFLARRVYKPGVYAVPYEGEEVAFHWANKDHYYIKTSEYLRDYTFRLRPDNDKNPMRVHFRLIDAAEGEHGNVKAAEGRDRVFILAASDVQGQDFAVEEQGVDGKELAIHFEFRQATLVDWPEEEQAEKRRPPVQKDLSAFATRRILAETGAVSSEWITELGKRHVTANGEHAEYSRLEAHLRRYTARNTFDYFIHKNLSTFLCRELDFYIKNEVMHLDDVENEAAPRVEQYLSKIKVIRRIAHKIIDFLAQIEDFQKKLWLKKKFVVETRWCIALGVIPEEFYQEIADNESQREEWTENLAIDEIRRDLTTHRSNKILSTEFLKMHPTLTVDTRHFDAGFTARILGSIGTLNEKIDGILFHGDNFQALTLMQSRYRQQVKCVYIDPPFNTSEASLLYKNEFRHSSWMALIQQGILRAKDMLNEESVLAAAIDDFENENLSKCLESTFGPSGRLGTLVVETKPSGRTNDRFLATCHEYYHFFGLNITTAQIRFFPLSDEARAAYSEVDEISALKWRDFLRTGGFSTPEERPNSYYAIYYSPKSGDVRLEKFRGAIEILPLDSDGKRRVWRKTSPSFLAHLSNGEIKIEKRRSGTWKVLLVDRVKEGTRPKSVWVGSQYDAASHGTKLLKNLFGEVKFAFPKAMKATQDVLFAAMGDSVSGTVLDYFAGSGTTGHAVINLNREDGGRRKFILVEMGDYFDTVLLPRIKKVIFTPEWKDGKSKRLATLEEATRSPRIIKVLRLESYEDTLNNLEIKRTQNQQLLLDDTVAQGADSLREDYILRYMLEVEARGSQSLLNLQAFSDPTSYKLKVKRPGSDESREVNVDLLETFNWLIGLRVRHIATPQTFSAEFERDRERRLRICAGIEPAPDGPYWFRTVCGTTPDGRETMVIWRKLTGEPEQDNLVLDNWFITHCYMPNDSQIDLIYVNGGNNLENLKTADDTWRVRIIEDDFHRLMFEMEQS